MKYRLLLWLLILMIGAMRAANAGAGPASQLPGEWRTYPTHAPVTALAAQGETLWVGTTDGLIRLNRPDGSSVTYTIADGLSDNAISTVTIGPDGNPWVGSWDGNLSHLEDQNWQIIRFLEAPEDNVYLSAIGFDSLGQAWYGLYGYGVYWRDEHFTSASGLAEDYVLAMALNGEEAWVGTRLGLSRYSRGTWTTFTQKEGLTDSTITALAVDSLGQVWAGTYKGGVNQFDGQEWTGFTTAEGLPDNRINAIALDAAGRPWVATPQGVSYFEGGRWLTYTSADGLAADDVKAITVDEEGHLWFGTEVGLSEFVPPPSGKDVANVSGEAGVTYFTSADGLADDRVWAITVDPDRRAWFGTYDHGVTVFDGQSWRSYTTSDGLAHDDVRAIFVAPDGHIWFGTGGGVSRFDGQSWRSYTRADGLASNGVEAVAQDKAGHIWATHLAEGVSRFDGSRWTTYTVEDGLADNWVHDVAVDPAGRVWFGTNAGVSVFDGQNWTTFTVAEGLVGDTVFAMAVDAGGHVWVGTTAGISEYDGQEWRTHLPGQPVNDLAPGPEGEIWVTGSGQALHFDGQMWTEKTPAHLAGQDLRAVAVGPRGEVWLGSFGQGVSLLAPPTPVEQVWVGTAQGVSLFDGTGWQSFTTADGLVDNEVRAIAIDPQGRKWFGTANGVSLFDGQAWTNYTPLTNSLVSNYLHTVAIDPSDRAWFGYGERGQGVTVFDGQHWTTYTTADGLADEHVYAIAFAPDGAAWVGTGAGVSHFDGQNWTTFTVADGLLDERIRAIAVGPDGAAWFGTAQGVSRFDGQGWQIFTSAEGLVAGPVNAIAIDPQGQVWVGAEPASQGDRSGGVSRFDGQSWTTFPALHDNSGSAGPSHGLVGDWVTDIAFDQRGQPWVGLLNHPLAKPLWVNGGVSHFDGQGWMAYTDEAGLVSDAVTAVAIDRNGHRWFGTQAGLSRFDGQNWTTFIPDNGLPHQKIRALAVDGAGHIWAATWGGGAGRFDGQGWSYYTTRGLADKQVDAIALDSNGQPWFATPGGVSHFDGQNWATYTTLDGLSDNYSNAIVADPEGHIWVGTGSGEYQGGGVSRFDGQSWTRYTGAEGLPRNNVSALAVDEVGQVWAVSYTPGQYTALSSLSRFDGQGWVTPLESPPLADDRVYSLVIDALGGQWFGTDGSYDSGGLVGFDGQNWRTYKQSDGLAGSQVYDIALDSAGGKWLATEQGVTIFDGESWQSYSPAGGVAGVPVRAVAIETVFPTSIDFSGAWQSVDPNFPFGVTLIQEGTQLKGWHCGTLPDGSRTDCKPEDSPEPSLKGEVRGNVAHLRFISGYSGAAGQATLTYTGDSLTWQISEPPAGEFYLPQQATLKMKEAAGGPKLDLSPTWMVLGELGETFTHLAAAPAGPVWAINSTQLLQVEGETWRVFDLPPELQEGIAANPSLAFPTVTDLAATDGAVWLATREMGLYQFAGGEWHHVTPAEGLPGETVLRLATGSQNQLWAIFKEDGTYSLARFEGQGWPPHPLPEISSAPAGLAVTPAGQIWLAVSGRAPFRFDGGQWQQPVEGWQAGSFDMFLAANSAGTVWFGSDNGWQRWTGQNWQELEVSIPAPFSFPAAVDANGGAWGIVTPFCYWCKLPNLNENGAVYVTPEVSCRFTAADGLGDPPLEPEPYAFDPEVERPDVVKDIAVAADGRVWFVTQDKLTVFNPPGPICDAANPENVRRSE